MSERTTTPGGLSAFPITPADEAGRVDVFALRALVARLCAAKVDSIGLLGSTGSYAYLSRAERRHALDAALDAANGGTPVVAGVGALRTDEAMALASDARDAGASAGLLAPVSYTPLTDDEVFEHYRAVAGVGLPISVYDNPGTTHFAFSRALLARLSHVDGIVAAKCPAGSPDETAAHLAALREKAADGFSIGYSGDWNAAEAMIAGADAWYSVLAGLFPEPCLAIVRAAQRGDAEEARRLNAMLEPVWSVFRELSSLRVIYAQANAMGLARHAPPRPILPLRAEARSRVAEAFEAAGLA